MADGLFVVLVSAYLASGARRRGKHALQYAQMTTVCHRQFLDRGFLT